MLQDWVVGFGRNWTLLPNAATRFSLLGLVGLSFLVPYLDYFLVPLFAIFLAVGLYGWMWGGQVITRR